MQIERDLSIRVVATKEKVNTEQRDLKLLQKGRYGLLNPYHTALKVTQLTDLSGWLPKIQKKLRPSLQRPMVMNSEDRKSVVLN